MKGEILESKLLSKMISAKFMTTITTGQWSGSGSDYYITVSASNVTVNSIIKPFWDKASGSLLRGPVWCVPAAGSFTIHTSAIPAGTVTIIVELAGVVGEAQYQVLADVYSKDQVDTIVAQSTADAILALDIAYSNVSVPATGSTYVSYTVPTRDGYSRAWVMLCRVSGSGTGNLVMTIHGDATSGTIYLSSGSGNAITANFTLRAFYVKGGMYRNVTGE